MKNGIRIDHATKVWELFSVKKKKLSVQEPSHIVIKSFLKKSHAKPLLKCGTKGVFLFPLHNQIPTIQRNRSWMPASTCQ